MRKTWPLHTLAQISNNQSQHLTASKDLKSVVRYQHSYWSKQLNWVRCDLRMLISSTDCKAVLVWPAQMDLRYKHLQSGKINLMSSVSLQVSVTITADTFCIYKNKQNKTKLEVPWICLRWTSKEGTNFQLGRGLVLMVHVNALWLSFVKTIIPLCWSIHSWNAVLSHKTQRM